MRQASSRILFALAVLAIPLSASADNAFTLRDAEVFTGPGSEYPPVATLPPNTRVDIAGCLSDWSWCDVNFADSRGWVYGADLGYRYQNNRVVIIEYGPRLGLPVVAFSLPAYWDAHYRGRPWYRERDVWVTRVHAQVDHGGRPPEGRPARAAQATPGGGAPSPSAGVTPQPGQTSAPQQPQRQPPQPQAAQPRQPAQAAQPSQAPQQSQSQITQPQGARSSQAGQPSQATPPNQAAQSTRPPEGRPSEGRPPEGRPPAGRPPEGRPPESAGRPESGPPSDRGDRGRQPEGKGPPEGRGAGGPDRDKQQQ
jgi:uncharacterized protein YraI